jgi:hypothetical protein
VQTDTHAADVKTSCWIEIGDAALFIEDESNFRLKEHANAKVSPTLNNGYLFWGRNEQHGDGTGDKGRRANQVGSADTNDNRLELVWRVTGDKPNHYFAGRENAGDVNLFVNGQKEHLFG